MHIPPGKLECDLANSSVPFANHEQYLRSDTTATGLVSKPTFDGRVQNRSGFNIGFEYLWPASLKSSVEIGDEQQLFYKGDLYSAGGILMQSIPIPYASFGLAANLIEMRPFSLEINGLYSVLGKTSTPDYAIELGAKCEAGVKLVQTLTDGSFFARGFYSLLNQNTALLALKRFDAGVELGWSTNIGASEPRPQVKKTSLYEAH